MPVMKRIAFCLLTMLISVSLHARPTVDTAGGTAASSVIDRFLTRNEPPLREYRARRTMRAVNKRFHAEATLEAMTELTADGTFRYEILREKGSGSVRKR